MKKNNQFSIYQCPKCGSWAVEETLIKRTEAERNHQKEKEFGVSLALDWREYHKCFGCGTRFNFINSNC